MEKSKIKISVFCIWRDNEDCIQRTLSQLEDLESLDLFSFCYYFYENDSKDKTASILKRWMEDRCGEVLSETLNSKKFGSDASPERMKLLCDCRNKSKDLAGKNKTKYSLIIDSDIIFNKSNFLQAVDDIKNLENAVMVTSNNRCEVSDHVFNKSKDCYYDAYPFKDKYGNKGLYMSDCPSYLKEDQDLWSQNKPIITMSSFGGFALVKSKIFNKVRWSSNVECDHVNMCYDISRFGRIYCDPKIKVYVEVGYENLTLSRCEAAGRKQLAYYNQYFK